MRLLIALATTAALCTACVTQRRSVCALDFDVISPDPHHTYLSQAIPEFLTSELSTTPSLEVEDPQAATERIDSLRRRWWSWRDYSRLETVGEALDVDYFITGSVTRLPEHFILESRLVSVHSGRIVPGTALRRTCLDEPDLVRQIPSIAEQMRHQLLVRTPAAQPPAQEMEPIVEPEVVVEVAPQPEQERSIFRDSLFEDEREEVEVQVEDQVIAGKVLVQGAM